MIVGLIKTCNHCGEEHYVRVEVKNCPECGAEYGTYKANKAPAGWVKMEDYEISRKNVEQMVNEGTLSMEDLK
jgi:hypothetical protein